MRDPDEQAVRRNGSDSQSGSGACRMSPRLVLSVSEAAHALGVSDDLIYQLTERGELPCLRFGRRKVIPKQAIQSVIELALIDFQPSILLSTLEERARPDRQAHSAPPRHGQPVPRWIPRPEVTRESTG